MVFILMNFRQSIISIQVWRINLDVPEEGKSASLDTGDGDRWWEQVDLKKLILASNKLKELSSEIRNLPALNVLDVCSLSKITFISSHEMLAWNIIENR